MSDLILGLLLGTAFGIIVSFGVVVIGAAWLA